MREVNISSLDLNLLVVLDQLLERKHVSRAAEALEMSQPGVSRALGRLRLMFGDPLLVSAGRHLALTPRAEALRAPLREVLAQTRELFAPSAFDPAQARFKLHLHTLDYGSLLFLPSLLERLRSRSPGIQVEVPVQVQRPLQQLREGSLDLLVGVYGRPGGEFHQQTLWGDRFVCVTRPGLVDELTLERFLALEHLMITTTGAPGGPVDEALAARGLERRLALRLPHFLAAPLVVAQSDLLLTLPERVAQRLQTLVQLEVWDPPVPIPPFEVDMLWHHRHHADPAHRWVRQQVVEAV